MSVCPPLHPLKQQNHNEVTAQELPVTATATATAGAASTAKVAFSNNVAVMTPSMAAHSGAPAHHHSADSLWKLAVGMALAAELA